MFVGVETCPPDEYATNAFSSEWKYENLALVGLVVKKKKLKTGYFTLFIYRGRQRNVQRFITHVHIHYSAYSARSVSFSLSLPLPSCLCQFPFEC